MQIINVVVGGDGGVTRQDQHTSDKIEIEKGWNTGKLENWIFTHESKKEQPNKELATDHEFESG